MKMIKMAVVLCFCSSLVFAETTLDMIQQRAEAGDATAQTLMGMMTFYGCQVPRDREASQKWYQRAADQGDSFAADRIFIAKKKFEVPQAGSSNHPSSIADSPKPSRSMSKEVLGKKVADASSSEYKGSTTVEDIILNRAEYVGKVVELKFEIGTVSTSYSDEIPRFYVHGRRAKMGQRLMLSDQQALEWAMNQSKRGYDASGKAYVLVDGKDLIVLGTKQSQADNGYIYSW